MSLVPERVSVIYPNRREYHYTVVPTAKRIQILSLVKNSDILSVHKKKKKLVSSRKILDALKNTDSFNSIVISYLKSLVNSLPMYVKLFMRLYFGILKLEYFYT